MKETRKQAGEQPPLRRTWLDEVERMERSRARAQVGDTFIGIAIGILLLIIVAWWSEW